MASRENISGPRQPIPRLYLTVRLAAGITAEQLADISAKLAQILSAADVAAVLLHLPTGDDRSLINLVKALAPTIQGHGAALLIQDHSDIAVRAGADGVHNADMADLESALAALKPDRIVGCGALESRHDAMVAAERGADYVMFGEPDGAGRRPPIETTLERIAWWAEVFEIPCVGFAAAPADIGPLVQAGAEFVAVGDWIMFDERGPARAIAEVTGQMVPPETVG